MRRRYPPDPSKMKKAIDKLALIRDDCGADLCCCDTTVALLRNTKGLFYTWPHGLTWVNTSGKRRKAAASPSPQKPPVSSSMFGLKRSNKIIPMAPSTTTAPRSAIQKSTTGPLDSASSNDLALLQFTSGSTGRPKGEYAAIVFNFLLDLFQT